MTNQEGVKTFYLTRIFLQAINSLEAFFAEKELKYEFLPPNRLKVYNWSQKNPACKRFKHNFEKTLDSLNVMKLNQPEKKVERIKFMKKWKKQFQIKGLNVVTVKKNYGNSNYLIGCASQLQLYQVLMNLQAHSYKTFSTSFVKFLYKLPLEALINSSDYQICVYNKLKITSTQLRILDEQNHNKKKTKLIELLFELQKYVSTKDLVEKFKEFLLNQFFVCGLIFESGSLRQISQKMSRIPIKSWKIIERKREQMVCIYVICKIGSANEIILSILNESLCFKYMTFLKGLGKGNKVLQPLIGDIDMRKLTPEQTELLESFDIKGNSEKNPYEISLSLKKGFDQSKWASVVNCLI